MLSDYAERNCKALRQWLDSDPAAYDWSSSFKFVVQELEGKDEEEVKKRQDLVRKLVKAVVHCDITQEPPIQSDYDQLYDVVICCLVLEGTASISEEYAANFQRLGKLVKRGGSILIYGIENTSGYYTIGDSKFPNIHVTAESAKKVVEDSGFTDVNVELLHPSKEQHRVYRFIQAIRSQ